MRAEEIDEELDFSNVRGKEDLAAFLAKVDEQQENGPFPTRDSDALKGLHSKLENGAINYDNEPVSACPHCKSLYLVDEGRELVCFNCGHTINEKDLINYSSIFSYLAENEDSKDSD